MPDTGAVLTAGVLGVSVVVWLVRLEGRVTLGEKNFANLKEDIDEIKQDVKELLRK